MVAPGDKVIVCQNGVFGGRMLENVIRAGGVPVLVEDKWGDPVDPHKLEDALKKNRSTPRLSPSSTRKPPPARNRTRRHW